MRSTADAAVALAVLGALFIVAERRFPLRRQRVFRPGWRTDVIHFFVDEVLASAGLGVVVVAVIPLSRWAIPPLVHLAIGRQPGIARYFEALALAEICGYWGHRMTHEVPLLWRFHKVHHSIETMDWLAPNRRHPVDQIVARTSVAIPLLVLGFPVPTLAVHFVFRRFQGVLVHANVRVRFGPLRWLVATPEFHHWHHADDPAAYNRNYAGQVPMVDWLFGTLHLPDHWPERYGIGERAPEGYLAQLAWPFQSRRRTAHTRAPATRNSRGTMPAMSVSA
jgi:sterol desaturase/sphingolipid hydroxylase (fatty acid hydroxylase superfamily)